MRRLEQCSAAVHHFAFEFRAGAGKADCSRRQLYHGCHRGSEVNAPSRVATESFQQCSCLQDDQLYTWGANANGQLGSGPFGARVPWLPQLFPGWESSRIRWCLSWYRSSATWPDLAGQRWSTGSRQQVGFASAPFAVELAIPWLASQNSYFRHIHFRDKV